MIGFTRTLVLIQEKVNLKIFCWSKAANLGNKHGNDNKKKNAWAMILTSQIKILPHVIG